MALAKHEVTINGKKFAMRLNDNYDDSDSNIGSALGIKRLGDNESFDEGTIPLAVGAGIRSGLLARLNIRQKTTGANPQIKTGKIICPIDKVASAITDLVGKNYGGNSVQSASIPQRRRLS